MKKFENSDYAVELTENTGCKVSVKVRVQPAPTKKAHKQAVKLVNKRISIPGFRKGKAPDETVLSRYGSYVDQEWKEILVNEAYKAALDLSNIYPVGRDSVEKPKILGGSLEEGFEIEIGYERYPEVPSVDPAALTIPGATPEAVSEEAVGEFIENLRGAYANWEPIEDRGVQEGDYAMISLDLIDQAPPEPLVSDHRVHVSDQAIAPWLYNLLIALESNQTVEGMTEAPADQEPEDEPFVPKKVRLFLKAIYKKVLPEVDEEFAKQIGADSLDDLRAKCRRKLENESEEKAFQEKKEQVKEALLEVYLFDIPASVLQASKDHQVNKRLNELAKEKLSDEERKEKEKEIEDTAHKESERYLRLFFLNKQIAKQAKLVVSEKELGQAFSAEMQRNPYYNLKNLNEQQVRNLVSNLKDELMERKITDYLLAHAKIA